MVGALVQTLSMLETELQQSMVRSDNDRVSALLHPNFEEVGRSGRRYTREAVVAAMLSKRCSDAVIADSYVATELCPGVMLLTYRSAHREENGALSRHTLRSSIWVLVGDNWQLRYHQGTAAAEHWSQVQLPSGAP